MKNPFSVRVFLASEWAGGPFHQLRGMQLGIEHGTASGGAVHHRRNT